MILLDLYHQATSLLSSILRLGSGAKLRGAASPPVQTLIL